MENSELVEEIRTIKEEWLNIRREIEQGNKTFSEGIAFLEEECDSILLTGVDITANGSEKEMELYAKHLVSFLELTKYYSSNNKERILPEVIVLEAMYIITITCIIKANYKPLKILLETKFDNPFNSKKDQIKLLEYKGIHYNWFNFDDTKEKDVWYQIEDYLGKQTILKRLGIGTDKPFFDYQLQANFLFVMLYLNKGNGIYPNFGRYQKEKVLPFVNDLLEDSQIRKEIAEIMNIDENEVRNKFKEYLEKSIESFIGTAHRWGSITPDDL